MEQPGLIRHSSMGYRCFQQQLHLFCHSVKKCIYFFERQSNRERRKNRVFFSSKTCHSLGWNSVNSLGLSCGCVGPKYVTHYLMLPGHISIKHNGKQRQDLIPCGLIWATSLPCGGLTHCATMATLVLDYCSAVFYIPTVIQQPVTFISRAQA